MNANARVEVGKPGRSTTTEVVEYEGAEKRLSLVEGMDGVVRLRVGVSTNEQNSTERRPNYKIDIEFPVDDVVARLLGNVLDRAEEAPPPYAEPHLHLEISPDELKAGGAPLTPRDWIKDPEGSEDRFLNLGIDPSEPELTEVDGVIITFGEVKDFREVVPGPGGGIRESEIEAFRRYRAQVEEDGFVGSVEDDTKRDPIQPDLSDGAETAEYGEVIVGKAEPNETI